MFAPEVFIKNWKDFEAQLKNSKVKVYWHPIGTKTQVTLQCYDGNCVFTHREPVTNYINGLDVTIFGQDPIREPSWYEMDEFKIVHKDPNREGATYTETDTKKLHKAESQWWEALHAGMAGRLQELGFVQGQFTSLVMVGHEEY